MDENEQPTTDESAGEALKPPSDASGEEHPHRDPSPAEDLENDEAYNPSDQTLRDLKGG